MNDLKILDSAIAFTETYKKYKDSDKAIREAMCCKELYPAILDDIREDDLFAGRGPDSWFDSVLADFSTQKGSDSGYRMGLNELNNLKAKLGPGKHAVIDELISFWLKESTFVKVRECAAVQNDPEAAEYLTLELDSFNYTQLYVPRMSIPKGIGYIAQNANTRLAGLMLDFDKLLRLGIPGLEDEIRSRMSQVEKGNGDINFFKGMLLSIETLKDVCRHYKTQADILSEQAGATQNKKDLKEMSRILDKITREKPETLREAIQLLRLYTLVARAINYARVDIYLGDFYARDIDSGKTSEEEAFRFVMALWKMIEDTGIVFDSRVVVGGKGRRNEKNADRFALAAMEATRRLKGLAPVLAMRFYKGQNPALMEKALDVIGEGCLYPTLYNDDVYIDGAKRIMDIPEADAEMYLPLGCGELILDHSSSGSPNSALNVPKAIEAALHNGVEPLTGKIIGTQTGGLDTFDTFEKLLAAVKKQIADILEIDVRTHVYCQKILAEECSFLYQSMLMDDCIARGKDLMSGGLKYLGACVEGFGFTNAGDSLLAIKQLVYEKKMLTLKQLTQILDADFEGYEEQRQWMLAVPKYGNNNSGADAMVADISGFIHKTAREIGKKAGLDYYIVSSVNPGGITLGIMCGATPDGRKSGEPFALGDSPTAGFDKSGLTSMLTSVSKSDPANGGYITNLKLSKEMLSAHRWKTSALLDTFFRTGGMQLNITVLGREDLENAMKAPEKYGHVIVRIGGYSARFIDLDKITQKEIMNRTLY